MNLKFIFLNAMFVGLFFTSCNLQKSNPLDLSGPIIPEVEVPVMSAELITFKIVNTQVLEKNCVGCHSVDGGNKGGVNLETYENVLKNIKLVRETIEQKTMPPLRRTDLKLSDSQMKLIIDWVDAGAKENGDGTLNPPVDNPPVVVKPPEVVIPPITGEILFAHVNEYVIQTNCVSCHSVAKGNKGRVNLESYEGLKRSLKKVKESILDGFMPPRRSKQMTDEQKKLIIDWIDAGAKEKADADEPLVVVPPAVEVEILFNDVMDAVITKSCVSCHSEESGNEGGVNLENYDNVIRFARKVKATVEDGSMPPRRKTPLTAEQKKMIVDWLEAGGKEK